MTEPGKENDAKGTKGTYGGYVHKFCEWDRPGTPNVSRGVMNIVA